MLSMDRKPTIVDETDTPWWEAQDVCAVLDLTVKNSVWYLIDVNKRKVSIRRPQRQGRGGDSGRRVIVNEAGLYKFIYKSRKPEAEKFLDRVTHTVFPSIRRTVGFLHATTDISDN